MKDDRKTMERPGLVGPMGEILVMDEDPVSGEIVYRIDNGTSSEGGVSRGVKVRRRSCPEAASKIYIRAKEHIVAFFDFHHVKWSMRALWNITATIYQWTPLANITGEVHKIPPKSSKR